MRDEPRVLIVDDQEGARITLECILEDAGYVVETADSGQDALQKAEQQAFDAALLDVRLPDMAGTEVLERLKRLCPECVVIMVTGHASVETAVSAVDHGASAYIRKPIDADHLLAKLSDELEKQSLISQNKRMVRTLSLLYSVNTALSQSLDMETTLADALAVALDGWGADAGAIWVREEGNGDWTLTVHRGLPARIVQDGARPTTSDGEPVSEPALGAVLRVADESGADELELVCVPLWHGAQAKGIMGFSLNGRKELGSQDLALLEAVGGHMGVAIQNMQLYAELQCAHRELQQAQARLVQTEKLSSLGQLISGIAHELNNPLAVVLGFAHHLTRSSKDEAVKHSCSRIYEQARRCSRIVDQLLTFAREYAPEWTAVDVNEVIRASVDLFAYKFRVRGIRVETLLDPDLPRTGADWHRLQQVFVNIISNAYQSFEGSGQGDTLWIRTSASDGRIRIVFADNGPGIPPENLTKVFDPFFTTKEVGKGTGLGLSVSYGIIKEHGGDISVESEPGKGAAFTIELPVQEAPEPEVQHPTDGDLSCYRGKRVLVVDDEEGVTDLVTRIITAAGGRVDAAPDGLVGKERATSGEYDLVIADMRMPKMDGQRFYEFLLAENPSVASRVVFCTGDVMDESTKQFLANVGRPVLTKPFSVEELAALACQVFEGEGPQAGHGVPASAMAVS